MPYVKKAGQGALGEDLAIKGKEKAITSFFQVKLKPLKPLPKRKQGRPRKTPPPQLSPSKRAKSQQFTNNGTAALALIPQRKPSRTYMNYKDPETAATLKEAINAYVSTGKLLKPVDLEVSHLPLTVISLATICYHAKKLSENNTSTRSSNDAGGGSSGWLNSGISEVFERSADDLSKLLTTAKMRELIANTIKFRDEAQNGMTRKEVIQLLVQLTGGLAKLCENHYDWMNCAKKLPQLKNNGQVQYAQAMTTKRACIRVEQQLRWHNTIECVWEEHQQVNQPSDEFATLQLHFQLNLNETSVPGCNGNICIVGSAKVKKHEKTMQDNHDSVTIVRIGSASGETGPWIFLLKGKKGLEKNHPLRNLERNFPGVLAGSKVVMTPNAYMTNEAWIKLTPFIANGIRNMAVIKDHPDWMVCMTLDEFGSHLVPEALQPFTDAKIEVVKEEGDTLQVTQANDQLVAKEDKKLIGDMLDTCRSNCKLAILNHGTIISACIHAFRKVEKRILDGLIQEGELAPSS